MANFQISITDPITGSPDLAVANHILTITDHSNYDEGSPEAGHARVNFSDYYKLKVVSPSGGVTLYSSLGDGDFSVGVPSAGDPIVNHAYTTGDGQYWIYIYSVPTYAAGASYLVINTPYVYYGGKIWRALQNTQGNTPQAGAYWSEVTDIDTLPVKYRLTQRAVIYADAKRTYARRMYNANAVNNLIGANWENLLRDPEFIASIELFISINAIPVLMAAERWAEVDTTINNTKQIASKYEVL